MSIPLASRYHHRAVQIIVRRLAKYGIRIENYFTQLDGEPFDEGPWGFNFFCTDPTGFRNEIVASKQFGKSWQVYEMLWRHPGCDQYREATTNGSVHIILNRVPGKRSIIHLDTVSIVTGCDPKSGRAIYTKNGNTLMKHLSDDLDHGQYAPGPILQ